MSVTLDSREYPVPSDAAVEHVEGPRLIAQPVLVPALTERHVLVDEAALVQPGDRRLAGLSKREGLLDGRLQTVHVDRDLSRTLVEQPLTGWAARAEVASIKAR